MRYVLSLMLIGSLTASVAHAQTPAPYVGELVMDQAGAPVGPWVEKTTCEEADACRTLIMNSLTLEVARSNGRLTAPFELTGRGLEVQRAEPELDKARRLKAEAAQD